MYNRIIKILPLFYLVKMSNNRRTLTKLNCMNNEKPNYMNKENIDLKKKFLTIFSFMMSLIISYNVKALDFETISYENFKYLLEDNKIKYVIIKKSFNGLLIVIKNKIYNLENKNKDLSVILNEIRINYVPIKYESINDFLSDNLNKIELIPVKRK